MLQKTHVKKDAPIKIIPLGGVEEVGRNMTVVEYGNDIIILDAGLGFPLEETPGIDFLIPNTKYLEENKSKIRGLIVSHGHLDHIGAIPYLMGKIGVPVIYTTKLTKAMILKRQEEFPHGPTLHIDEVKSGDRISLGKFRIRFFDISHSIADAIGTIIETPLGNIIYPGDFKMEFDSKGKAAHIDQYTQIGRENNLLLLMESTNSEVPGFSISGETVHRNLEKIISEAKGRVIIGTFSSQLERIIELIKIAERHNRKVVIDGYSMKANLDIAVELGFFRPKKEILMGAERLHEYQPEKILIVCTGSQGEENSALMRVANRKHKYIRIQKGDTVILSSSIIPGNEMNIQNLKDNLARQNAHIIHYKTSEIHTSGHATQEELKLMIKTLRPKFFVPVHGYYFMLKINADLAESLGMKPENIVVPLNNGSVIEANRDKIRMLKESVAANYVMVDGLGVGDVKEIVLRDRQMLAQDGIFVVITIIDSQTGKVRNSPDIISRGFIYLKESQDLLRHTRYLIKKTIEEATEKMHPVNISYVKDLVREKIGKFLFQKTKRRPMVLPVLIEV